MTAISARKDVHFQDGVIQHYKVAASTTIPEGALVTVNAAGYARNATEASGEKFVGVADRKANNSAGANGAIDVYVRAVGVCDMVFNAGDAAIADVGSLVYVIDNQTVGEASETSTADVLVGTIEEVVSATKVRVRLNTTAAPAA